MKRWPALIVTLMVALSASAGDNGMQPGMHLHQDFDRIDEDRSGSISWVEFRNRLREMFFFSDLDNDGAMTRGEAPRGLAGRFDTFDLDNSRGLSLEEFVNGHHASFEQADHDRDGGLSREEVDALREAHRDSHRGVKK